MTRVQANTVVDDRALLVRAHAEIARLKTLLVQALKRAERAEGSEGSGGMDMGMGSGGGGEWGGEGEAAGAGRLAEENEHLRRENAEMRRQLRRDRKSVV